MPSPPGPVLFCAATAREIESARGIVSDTCILSVTGVGIPMTLARLPALIAEHRPALIVNIGIAGAYPGSGLAIGDLAAGESEVFGDLGMELPGPEAFLPLGEMPWADEAYKRPLPLAAALSTTSTMPDRRSAAGSVAHPRAGKGCTVNACAGTRATGERRRRLFGADFETMEGAAVALAGAMAGIAGGRAARHQQSSRRIGICGPKTWTWPCVTCGFTWTPSAEGFPVRLSAAISPCPNDVFIFAGLILGKVKPSGWDFDFEFHELETLNQGAIRGRWDLVKISYANFRNCAGSYALLRCGGALGRGCGPLLLSNGGAWDPGAEVLVPGEHTTANFLLDFLHASVGKGAAPAQDLPALRCAVPPPAGAAALPGRGHPRDALHLCRRRPFAARRSRGPLGGGHRPCHPPGSRGLAPGSPEPACRTCPEPWRTSSARAWPGRGPIEGEALELCRRHAQSMAEDVLRSHIDLYVTGFTQDLGAAGDEAVRHFLARQEAFRVLRRCRLTWSFPRRAARRQFFPRRSGCGRNCRNPGPVAEGADRRRSSASLPEWPGHVQAFRLSMGFKRTFQELVRLLLNSSWTGA